VAWRKAAATDQSSPWSAYCEPRQGLPLFSAAGTHECMIPATTKYPQPAATHQRTCPPSRCRHRCAHSPPVHSRWRPPGQPPAGSSPSCGAQTPETWAHRWWRRCHCCCPHRHHRRRPAQEEKGDPGKCRRSNKLVGMSLQRSCDITHPHSRLPPAAPAACRHRARRCARPARSSATR